MRSISGCCALAFVVFAFAAPVAAELIVDREIVGRVQTNCYLIYDSETNEAALIDVGGPIPRLRTIVDEKGLEVKYIFITHAHPDHLAGVPAMREQFPHAKLCMSRQEYEDTSLYRKWQGVLDPKEVAQILSDPAAAELMNFDATCAWPVNVFVEDGQTFALGNVIIRAMLLPGHSRGGISYVAGGNVFTGDVLFFHSVGRTSFGDTNGWDTLVTSVRRLYSSLPDDTAVYPGHRQSTDIGTEKRENPRISESAVNPRR